MTPNHEVEGSPVRGDQAAGHAKGPRRRVGRILGGLFFAVFALVGLTMGVAMVVGFLEAVAVWFWDEVACEIEFSEIFDHETTEERFELQVEYRFYVRNRVYRGDSVDPGYHGSNDPAETQRLADRYAAGTGSTCRVDPDDPERSHLRRPSLWFGFALALPLLFITAGGVGAWYLWRPRSRPPASSEKPISGRARRKGPGWTLFSWVFFLTGGAIGTIFLVPALRMLDARGWDETTCEILESRVGVHQGEDGATFSVDVIYKYAVDGREYRSGRYRFLSGSSSGQESKQAVVDRLPPGSTTTCWVDGDDPYEAVLDRGLGWEFLFIILPLVFISIGAPGAVMSILRVLGGASEAVLPPIEIDGVADLRFVPVDEREEVYADAPYRADPKPLKLAPTLGVGGRLITIIVVALLWNGLLSVFLWFLIDEWRRGNVEWLMALFLSPFVLVGLLLLIGIPHQILALANPRPVLTLTPGRIPVGGSSRLDWRFDGALGRLSGLRLQLEGKEAATWRSGDDAHTRTEVFHLVDLVRGDSLLDPRQGSVRLEVPAGVMHSFDGGNNKVVWTLKLRGEIRFWPDVTGDFEINVVPPPRSES